MVSNWLTEFGFSKNPYDTRALSAEEGDRLLVGRDKEVNSLIMQLTTSSKIPILIGDNGVGKSSIVNVAAYRMGREYAGENCRYLVLDLNQEQSTLLLDLNHFEESVYLAVIGLLLKEENFLKQKGINPKEISDVDKLFQSLFSTVQGQVGISLFSIGGGVAPNPSPQYALIRTAKKWLGECFPDLDSGGIICFIDNLENFGTSKQILEILKRLRDTLFTRPGLRWVLCGTPVVLEGVLNSRNLAGRLAPQKIEPIKKDLAPELLKRRIEHYGNQNVDPPIDESLFRYLYTVVHSQLRIALGLCEEFAIHLYSNPERRASDRHSEFKIWLAQKAACLPDKEYEVTDESWQLFDLITDLGTDILSTDAWIINFSSEQELDKAISQLTAKDLLERIEMDNNGYMLRVTQDGWFVDYKRKNYNIAGDAGDIGEPCI